MSIQSIILHAGIFKTGSTSLQVFLSENRQRLKRKGFLYPGPSSTHVDILFNYIAFDRIKKTTNIDKSRLDAIVADFLKEAKESNCHTLILSSEMLGKLQINEAELLKEFLKNVFGDIPIKVIAYVRNPVDLIKSLYNQDQISTRIVAVDLDKGTINGGYSLYKLFLFNINTVFHEDFSIHKFEEALKDNNGLGGHFLKSLGAYSSNLRLRGIKIRNQSGSQEAIDFIRYIDENLPLCTTMQGKIRNNEGRSLDDRFIFRHIRGKKFTIAAGIMKKFLYNIKDDLKWLEDTFGVKYSELKFDDDNIAADTYSGTTLDDFATIFPLLTPQAQELFFKFFTQKHLETKDHKFAAMYMECSFSYKIYMKNQSLLAEVAELKKQLAQLSQK
ncbi:hypothetical protein LJC59_07800 [Desulfovibrio sp. OttesenSCG-928-A18]|nr:hypothetical protein [Desulfovibrio sp. OttesenSCG-928-A18]